MSTSTSIKATQTMNDYLFLFRGGVDMKTLPPEQMEQLMGAWFGWIQALQQKGAYKGGDPLDDAGRVVTGAGGKSITDGPFAEGKEEVGGYIMISAASLDEASELAKGCPVLLGGGSVEVRMIIHMPM
jgi:hypothetical protein